MSNDITPEELRAYRERKGLLNDDGTVRCEFCDGDGQGDHGPCPDCEGDGQTPPAVAPELMIVQARNVKRGDEYHGRLIADVVVRGSDAQIRYEDGEWFTCWYLADLTITRQVNA